MRTVEDLVCLLDRCTEAYVESFGEALRDCPDACLRAGVAGLLLHVGAELIVMDQLQPGVSAMDGARMLIDAARTQCPAS